MTQEATAMGNCWIGRDSGYGWQHHWFCLDPHAARHPEQLYRAEVEQTDKPLWYVKVSSYGDWIGHVKPNYLYGPDPWYEREAYLK